MQKLHWTNYIETRRRKFIDGINEIHKALIEHGDVYPRNMMIVEGDPERVVWIDFDRAQTYYGERTERQKEWFEMGKLIVVELGEDMVCGPLLSQYFFYGAFV